MVLESLRIFCHVAQKFSTGRKNMFTFESLRFISIFKVKSHMSHQTHVNPKISSLSPQTRHAMPRQSHTKMLSLEQAADLYVDSISEFWKPLSAPVLPSAPEPDLQQQQAFIASMDPALVDPSPEQKREEDNFWRGSERPVLRKNAMRAGKAVANTYAMPTTAKKAKTATSGKDPATSGKDPADPATSGKDPADPATSGKGPADSATSGKGPATSGKDQATSGKGPATSEKDPADPATTGKTSHPRSTASLVKRRFPVMPTHTPTRDTSCKIN
jgi:hypothetical protein